MSIAAVTRVTNMRRPDADKAFLDAAADKVRAMDGCESLISLASSDGTDGMVVTVWKDQAAYDSYARVRGEMVADTQRGSEPARAATIDQPQLYDVVYRT